MVTFAKKLFSGFSNSNKFSGPIAATTKEQDTNNKKQKIWLPKNFTKIPNFKLWAKRKNLNRQIRMADFVYL